MQKHTTHGKQCAPFLRDQQLESPGGIQVLAVYGKSKTTTILKHTGERDQAAEQDGEDQRFEGHG